MENLTPDQIDALRVIAIAVGVFAFMYLLSPADDGGDSNDDL